MYPLFSDRLSIQPLATNDVAAFVKYRQNPDVARYQSWEATYSIADAVSLVEGQKDATLPTKGDWLQLAVHERQTNTLVGDIALHSLDAGYSSFELGFTLAPEYQGRGFAREAVAKVISYLVEELGATHFEASTDRRNIRSSNLLTAVGFQLQPTRSWEEDFKNEWVTVDVYEASYPRLK